MKISEISPEHIRLYLHLEEGETDYEVVDAAIAIAKAYILGKTGLTAAEAEKYEDLYLPFMIICQDVYDNRAMYPDMKYANSGNRTVETILEMHRRNFL